MNGVVSITGGGVTVDSGDAEYPPQMYASVLEMLAGERVVAFEVVEDGRFLDVSEQCDNYFGQQLDKAAAEKMLAELTALVATMKA